MVAVEVRGGEQHTIVAALAGLDRDDFPAESIDMSTGGFKEGFAEVKRSQSTNLGIVAQVCALEGNASSRVSR